MMLSGCGGNTTPGGVQIPLTLSGNWQFTMAPPPDGSFLGGPQGGFLLEKSGTVTGGATYAVYLPVLPFPCSNGSGTVTGSISDQTVTLTIVAGTQTYALSGTLSSDSTTMAGTYTSTAGTATDGSPCGTAQTGLQWSATLVPALVGPITGSFHSTGGTFGLANQDFAVTGSITQGNNTGASTATVTGNLNFLSPINNQSLYPCLGEASVNGQISGNTVMLQIVAADGSVIGQIGEPAGSYGSTGLNPLIYNFATGGPILNGAQPTYMVATATNACAGTLDQISNAGDFGNVCLGVNGASACNEPITLTPGTLSFPALVEGKSSKQTVTLANNSSSTINGLTVALADSATPPNFTETDNCGINGAPSAGEPFSLISQSQQLPGWFCTITIKFEPQTSCTAPPSTISVTAMLTVTSPVSADNDKSFTVPVVGTETCSSSDASSAGSGFGR